MSSTLVRTHAVFVVANTPQLRERGMLWFRQNLKNIQRGILANPFWQRHTLLLHEMQPITRGEVILKLGALGYERAKRTDAGGTYSVAGGVLHIAPINAESTVSIEFSGNVITTIYRRAGAKNISTLQKRIPLISTLRDGDYVVHEHHGVGIWRGLTENRNQMYFLIEYAPRKQGSDPDALLVPAAQETRITPYIGFRAPLVHRLGTPLWKRTIKKTKDNVLRFARELLEVFAEREMTTRPAYQISQEADRQFVQYLEYTTTRAQEQAVKEIFRDLRTPRPMERLLVGDVGFGKTDVAIRAALQVVLSGKQAAVLVPTTILADQHYTTFKKHLAHFPVIIKKISRLEKPHDARDTARKLAAGSVDIIIGTHRLLSRDIRFHNLGLVIIDEEQRFGVKSKEHLKKLKKEIDVLTLSATPLPRTLYFALSSLKPMSLISEPPPGRIAPETLIHPYGRKIVKNAILRELKRGGQIYFLANRIHDIPHVLEELTQELPRVRFGVLHGRLPDSVIANIMNMFRSGKIDVLLSTTIIENGIDLHNANTLIVHDATRLGLAQAHQLRGRIGRSNVASYAYFCYPLRLKTLLTHEYSKKTVARLETLLDTQFLGSGEIIAKRDLEMRGAGNILGKEQSGNANTVGLNLYCQMLAHAVEQLREKDFLGMKK